MNVCKTKNAKTQYNITNIGDFLTIAQAFNHIPGVESIRSNNC